QQAGGIRRLAGLHLLAQLHERLHGEVFRQLIVSKGSRYVVTGGRVLFEPEAGEAFLCRGGHSDRSSRTSDAGVPSSALKAAGRICRGEYQLAAGWNPSSTRTFAGSIGGSTVTVHIGGRNLQGRCQD